jgi:hypothetical protein
MRSLLRIGILFLAVVGVASLMMNVFGVEFGSTDYWDRRGAFFLFFITLFPRLTLLFSSVVSGGFFWWLGWLFAPRLLVALLATTAYWETNPALVFISWLVAFSGELGEKYLVSDQLRVVVIGDRPGASPGDTIEGEFRRMD